MLQLLRIIFYKELPVHVKEKSLKSCCCGLEPECSIAEQVAGFPILFCSPWVAASFPAQFLFCLTGELCGTAHKAYGSLFLG